MWQVSKKRQQGRAFRRKPKPTRHQVHIERTDQPFAYRAILPYRARANEVAKTMSADILWAEKWRQQNPEPAAPRPYDLNLIYTLCARKSDASPEPSPPPAAQP